MISFNIIGDKGFTLDDWEKLNYIINAIPESLELIVVINQNENNENIIEEVSNSVRLLAYIHKRDDSIKKLRKVNRPIKKDNMMDIDYIKKKKTLTINPSSN
jgi:hypothetical protein